MKKTLIIMSVAVMIMSHTPYVSAHDEVATRELIEEIRALKKRVEKLEAKCARQDEVIAKNRAARTDARDKFAHVDTHLLHEEDAGYSIDGFRIGAGGTLVTQAVFQPNTEPSGNEEETDATYSVDIEIEKAVGDDGLAFIHMEAGDGGGLDGDEVTTFSGVNRDTGDSDERVEVTEAWYEQIFFDGKMICTAGKLDQTVYLDQNEIAHDETSQFLSYAFRNSTALEFSDGNTIGMRISYLPVEWTEFTAGGFDDDADWESIFEDVFFFAQAAVSPLCLPEDMPGNYRIYGWWDETAHAEWDGSGEDANFGFGLSADQKILDYVTLFGRWGWQYPGVSVIEWAWSTGARLDGEPWGRDGDYIGAAVGMDMPSGKYENAGNAGADEGHLEAYYNAKMNDHLYISPHYQMVWNPNGVDGDGAMHIMSLRGQVDF